MNNVQSVVKKRVMYDLLRKNVTHKLLYKIFIENL